MTHQFGPPQVPRVIRDATYSSHSKLSFPYLYGSRERFCRPRDTSPHIPILIQDTPSTSVNFNFLPNAPKCFHSLFPHWCHDSEGLLRLPFFQCRCLRVPGSCKHLCGEPVIPSSNRHLHVCCQCCRIHCHAHGFPAVLVPCL